VYFYAASIQIFIASYTISKAIAEGGNKNEERERERRIKRGEE